MDYEKKYKEALERARAKYAMKDQPIHQDLVDLFPELKESEDEKIRKAIYNCVKWFGFDSCFFKDVSQEECLAWFEKQGEKNINNSIWHKVEPKEYVLEKTLIYKKNGEIDIVEDTILSAVDAEYALPISYLGKPESIEKQGEQKDILEDATLDNNEDGLIAATIKAKCEQKPAEWSEEDENKRKLCFQYLTSQKNYQSSVGIDYINGCLDWLDSLPNRVQPKQEWSEEDEDNIFNIVGALDVLLQREIEKQHNGDRNASPKYYSDLQDWLKSLRPDSHWKPSQEQMDALWKLMQYAPNLSVYTDIKESVESLYNDLKKLKN